ncbi:hypothetical protein AB0N97_40180 [Streptomyces collinus]|uniref:hypothetical protein n=1 Tax=Streptomyces collinus TaxID=42684 RepID=UPI00342A7EAD
MTGTSVRLTSTILEVIDNGRELPAQWRRDEVGLSWIAERAEEIGGRCAGGGHA